MLAPGRQLENLGSWDKGLKRHTKASWVSPTPDALQLCAGMGGGTYNMTLLTANNPKSLSHSSEDAALNTESLVLAQAEQEPLP